MLDAPTVKIEDVKYSYIVTEKGQIRTRKNYPGVFESQSSETVSFDDVNSVIEEILVDEGDIVEKGQVLVKLLTRDLEFDVEQQRLTTKKAQLDVQAKQEAGASELEIETAKVEYEKQLNELEYLEKKLEDSVLRAPRAGMVSTITSKKPGESITAKEEMVTIVDPSELCVAYYGDAYLALPEGTEVTLAYSGKEYPGVVQKSYQDATQWEEGGRRVEVVFSNVEDVPDTDMLGENVTIYITTYVGPECIIIPTSCVQVEENRNYVYVLEGEERKERDVELGADTGTEVEVLSGLEEGETVILR